MVGHSTRYIPSSLKAHVRSDSRNGYYHSIGDSFCVSQKWMLKVPVNVAIVLWGGGKMNRRHFTILAGYTALTTFSSTFPIYAFRSRDYTSVVDRSILIPSPIAYEIQTCRMIGERIKAISKIDVLQRIGVTGSENIDVVREQVAKDIDRELQVIEFESAKLKTNIDVMDNKQAEETLRLIKSSLAFVATVLFAFTAGKVLLFGTVLLTAYSVGDFIYQTSYREADGLEMISFVTNTRNSLISLIPLLSKHELHPKFGYYAVANEVVMFVLGAGQYYKNYRLTKQGKDKLSEALRQAGSKAAQLRHILHKHLSNNADFVELLEFCKMATIDALTSYMQAAPSKNSCHKRPTVDALKFFQHFNPAEFAAAQGRSINVIP